MNINFHLRALLRGGGAEQEGTAGQLSAGAILLFQAALVQVPSLCLQAWVPSLPQSVKALVNLVLVG